eukprot:CAMPEP_0115330522 /NCGR_PEP_ID=MMETSP0270-20121206/85816_1 /TAXON_ID=71861 /ORGANISM="Scrippsiella trochoidea, Strain CCMP3099" /LENGTH=514 /DNA_ID=CAMNT_0002751231 /DNA_START=46 /DNA_END=1590 /DNA_ORIENTATION=-
MPAAGATIPTSAVMPAGTVVPAGAALPAGTVVRAYAESPLATSRMSLAARSVTAPTTFVTAPPAGASFVAAPTIAAASPTTVGKVVYAAQPTTVAVAPGAVQFRPSFVATPASGTAPVAATVSSAASTTSTTPAVVTAATAPAAPVMAYAPSTTSVLPPTYVTAPAVAKPSATTIAATRAVPEVQPAQSVSIDYVQALEKRLADLEILHACKTHGAFVFIKPHAMTEEVKQFVREHLASVGIFVQSEGMIPAEDIDQHALIDTHYGAIAAKAVKERPANLTVQPKAQEEFEQLFGLSWEEALQQDMVFNAIEGAEALGISTEELGARWGALQKGVDLLKFGGGFYCGKVENVFIINGFYLGMRAKFTTPGTCIYFFEVEWDARQLSWADFRGKVLGGTDPAAAEEGSARSTIFKSWEALGLVTCPDTGDNGVHASASPFEALAERANWLNLPIESDFFGKALLASGLPLSTIQEWCSDPLVSFEDKRQSLFDLLEDLNSRECLQKCSMIVAENA